MRGECAPLPPHCRHGDTLAGESTSNPYLRDAGPLTAFWPMKASFATLETRRRLRSPKAGTIIGPMFDDVLRGNGSEDWMSPRATRLLGRVFLYVFIQPHSRRGREQGVHAVVVDIVWQLGRSCCLLHGLLEVAGQHEQIIERQRALADPESCPASSRRT